MTKADLVEIVKDRLKLPRTQAEGIVDQLLESLKIPLVQGEQVQISSFGKFIVRRKRARIGRNPQTGEPFEIAPRRVIRFRFSPVLKSLLNPRREN